MRISKLKVFDGGGIFQACSNFHDFSCFQAAFRLVQAYSRLRIVKGTHVEGFQQQNFLSDEFLDVKFSVHARVLVSHIFRSFCGEFRHFTMISGMSRFSQAQ